MCQTNGIISIMSEETGAELTATALKKITLEAHMGLSSLMSAIYNVIITQIIVSWHALGIIPHYDWQYFSPFGT